MSLLSMGDPGPAPCTAPCPFTLRLFGPFEARVHGHPLPPLYSRKGQSLLALLALAGGRSVERPWLAGTLWPENDESQALSYLRRTLSDVRRALGAEAPRLASPTRSTLRLDPTGAWVDVFTFDEALCRGDLPSLDKALGLYGGPLLEGCTEEWVFAERAAREAAFFRAGERVAGDALARSEPRSAIPLLERMVGVDPLRETARRMLIEAWGAVGASAEATRVYREFRLKLRNEMNTEPHAETQAAYERVRAASRPRPKNSADAPEGSHAEGSPVPPPPRSIPPLPQPLTSFIGREGDLAETSLMLGASRLLTLTGSGGVGKTRLALQVAADEGEEYLDGVGFVELAGLSDPELVAPTVAQTLGLPLEGSRPALRVLLDHLKSRNLLLVLDNCEHLLPACAALADELLKSCPRLRVLSTSREGLGVGGEKIYRVPSLSHPAPRRADSIEELGRYEAVRLFVERAASRQPGFAVTEANAPALARVCSELEGIPLALELAAARVGSLPVEEIAARLGDRFRLLTGGSRTALPRHRTLRALIDWGYDLLSGPERALLRRLSVFEGEFSLAAAEAVCPGGEIGEGEVIDLLSALADKSLVDSIERGAEPRYRLLETIRRYAREKRTEPGETEGTARRHFSYYLSLAEEAEKHLSGEDQPVWRERLDRDYGNMRAALEWSLAQEGDGEALLRLVGHLGSFWIQGSYLHEGKKWAALAFEKGRDAPLPARLKGAEVGLYVGAFLSDHETTDAFAAESLRLARVTGERYRIAKALFGKTVADMNRGDYDAVRSGAEEGLALAREGGDLGLSARHLSALGIVAWMRGNPETARDLLRETLEISRAQNQEWFIGLDIVHLACVTRLAGSVEEARDLHREGLALYQRRGDRRGIAYNLVGMAGVEARQGRAERAARLLGAADGLLEAVGACLRPHLQVDHDRTEDQTREILGAEAFAAVWGQGGEMTVNDSVAYALGELE